MSAYGISPRISGNGSFMDRAFDQMNNAGGTRSRMQPGQKTETELPGPTVGGAISAGVGGAAAGASIGSAVAGGAGAGSSAGPWGAAIGAVVGLAAYLLG